MLSKRTLEHDIGGYFNQVEGGNGAFTKGAATILAAKHGIPQVRCMVQAGVQAEQQSGQFIECSLGEDWGQ